MKQFASLALAAVLFPVCAWGGNRSESVISEGWQFAKGTVTSATQWQSVSVPHDWAIYGPFDRSNDLQVVAVEQNGETEKTVKTGRTGGLPYIGKGEYRTTFTVPQIEGKSVSLVFDGAMSNARVKVNGKEVGHWAFGYNSFHFCIDDAVKAGENTLQVSLENYPESSRWYPGAGLYRHVHLVVTDKVHVPVWGTYVTTPNVSAEFATVNVRTRIEGANKADKIEVRTELVDAAGKVVSHNNTIHTVYANQPAIQNLCVENPVLWSPQNPYLYKVVTRLLVDGVERDCYTTRIGIRKLEYIPEKGFFLNGEVTKFKGVCNHHDLGPLGAAVNRAALRHQLELLKDMGCNAIRTSHNMPAPELVELCDEMGFMMMIEPFDDWAFRPKCKNGYGSIFNEWAERDMVNMLHHYRNNASVVMWSVGNEVPSQWGPDGVAEMNFLQDICHREDPTRPVTCGMDQFDAVTTNGFAAALDIPGFNYKVKRYTEAYGKLPQHIILGSETASTVSSRGVYMFPVEPKSGAMYDNHQSSSYDLEYCYWSNIPDLDFAADDDLPWMIGQFVWTGFDYLGEPTPYDTDAWPNHSSVFGIIDLASLPKDRYYLYRSKWNTQDATLHVLPHWNWKGREGKVTPVFVYTSYPKAELFINGKSQGVREKNDSTVVNRYRLMWNEVKYAPGELRVVAYDAQGNKAAEKVVKTAGKPHHLVATVNRSVLAADGEDLAYVTVQVADRDGNLVPTDNRLVKFGVSGAGEFLATANGDPTCLLPFQGKEMNLFSGALTAIVKAGKQPGTITFTAKAAGVKPVVLSIDVK
ncbi:MAG: glycoside hydrolase family 2 TIM barrel-domain containing protein [Muribaculaceae bacterium]